jgi:hypothetical protein
MLDGLVFPVVECLWVLSQLPLCSPIMADIVRELAEGAERLLRGVKD